MGIALEPKEGSPSIQSASARRRRDYSTFPQVKALFGSSYMLQRARPYRLTRANFPPTPAALVTRWSPVLAILRVATQFP